MTHTTRENLLASFKAGVHLDGRKLTEYRSITVRKSVTRSAEGSAHILLGETELYVGVKLGIEKPYPDTPEQGNLMVNAELRPISCEKFEVGPPGDEAVELARVVDRGIRESHAIDTHALCITPREAVWSVMIDVCTVNATGGLIDASGLAALAALLDTTFPKNTDTIVHYEERTDKALPIDSYPVPVTVYKFGEYLVVDPLPEEEEHADARLTIAMTERNTICALQKGGVSPLTADEILAMIDIALKRAPELRKHVLR